MVQALTELYDFNEFFTTEFNEEETDTIGGTVLHEFGLCGVQGCTHPSCSRRRLSSASSVRIWSQPVHYDSTSETYRPFPGFRRALD